jgi:undecaprenyl phosphate-alpha-L-ara4N flippase subunit ArnE
MSSQTIGFIFIVAAACAEAFAQAALKRGAGKSADMDSVWISVRRIARTGWMWSAAGFALFIVDAGFWTLALQRLPVSEAFPLQSLGLVAIAIVARIFLGERISSRRWMAIGLILAGTVLVGA